MHIIFVGPKKTATTAVYNVFKNHKSKINLLPKESNTLIKRTYAKVVNGEVVIDISPQYFGSYAALFNVHRMVEAGGKVQVVVLKRNEDERLSSHISYMMKKREISERSIGDEFDTICLQNDVKRFTKLWRRVASTYYEFSIQDKEFKQFISNILGEEVKQIQTANDGNFIPRRGFTLAKTVAKLLRLLRLYWLVEKIANSSLRALFYKKEKSHDLFDFKFQKQIKNFIVSELEHEE